MRLLIPVMPPFTDHEPLFRAWMAEHRGIVMKVTASFARSASDLADLRQEALLQLWISLASFRGQAKPSTWIYRVCLNTALAWRRDATRREQPLDPLADISRVAADTVDPAEDASSRELMEKLLAGIRALPELDRALILMSLDGLSYREITEVTGMTETHVGVALTRARRRLVTQMKGVIDEME